MWELEQQGRFVRWSDLNGDTKFSAKDAVLGEAPHPASSVSVLDFSLRFNRGALEHAAARERCENLVTGCGVRYREKAARRSCVKRKHERGQNQRR